MNERPSTYELTIERTLAAPPERVFRAWTEPAELARWFAPNPELPTEAEVDLRVGGAYSIRMGRHEVVGTFVAIDAPRTLAFTWRWASEEGGAETLVTVLLAPVAHGTRLTLRHERFESEEERSNHEDGWGRSLARLVDLPWGETEAGRDGA